MSWMTCFTISGEAPPKGATITIATMPGMNLGNTILPQADDDAFIGGLIRSGQGFDEMEDWGEQGYDSDFDALEDALADPWRRRTRTRFSDAWHASLRTWDAESDKLLEGLAGNGSVAAWSHRSPG